MFMDPHHFNAPRAPFTDPRLVSFFFEASLEFTHRHLSELSEIDFSNLSAGKGHRQRRIFLPLVDNVHEGNFEKISAALEHDVRRVRKAQFIPVAHIAITRFDSKDILSRYIGKLAALEVRDVFIIHGDKPANSELGNSRSLIEEGLLDGLAPSSIGFASFPEGNIGRKGKKVFTHFEALENLKFKIEATRKRFGDSIKICTVSQICPFPDVITRHVSEIRQFDRNVEVLTGVVSPSTSHEEFEKVAKALGQMPRFPLSLSEMFDFIDPQNVFRLANLFNYNGADIAKRTFEMASQNGRGMPDGFHVFNFGDPQKTIKAMRRYSYDIAPTA